VGIERIALSVHGRNRLGLCLRA